jgi:hypothetical protein
MLRSPMRTAKLFIGLVAILAAVLAPAGPASATPARTTANMATPAQPTIAPADPSSPCQFQSVYSSCTSTNPQVTIDLVNDDNPPGCLYNIPVNWGDGSAPQYVETNGAQLLASHTYTQNGTYTITVSDSHTTGNCFFSGQVYLFTLDACTTDYLHPADWNTEKVDTITPGVEPLNVIISACSTVPLSSIYNAMSSDWTAGCTGLFKVSNERADVAGDGYQNMDQAWRQGGCAIGDYLSLFGLEDHVRMWVQAVPGSTAGTAEFFTASFETACVQQFGHLKPLLKQDGTYRVGLPWHCIDGGPGSYFINGYGHGAQNFAASIVSFAQAKGWWTHLQIEPRPRNPANIDEDGVEAPGQVYVVTVDYNAPPT